MSRQIWWVQVVDGRPQARLHSCEGRSPSFDLVQICRIWFAGTSCRSLATCPKRPSLRLRTMYETSNRPVRCRTSSLDTKSCHLMCRMRRWHRTWNESSLFQSACMRVQVVDGVTVRTTDQALTSAVCCQRRYIICCRTSVTSPSQADCATQEHSNL